jgi:4-hydroxyphenylpyruvate dioxygenase-like putative hemolysin
MGSFIIFSGTGIKPLFYNLPGRIYPIDYNISAVNEVDHLNEILKKDSLNNGVVFYFFFDENNAYKKKTEDFNNLLKENLKNCVADFRLHFKLHKTEGTIFLNYLNNKNSINHLNALVYSNNANLLKKLFGNGVRSLIDTTTTAVKKFEFEFCPVRINTNESSFLYLFRSKLQASHACNPEQDAEIVAILKKIFHAKPK